VYAAKLFIEAPDEILSEHRALGIDEYFEPASGQKVTDRSREGAVLSRVADENSRLQQTHAVVGTLRICRPLRSKMIRSDNGTR
jgi:hypothetical protein